MELRPIEELELIKIRYFSGELNYSQAKELAQPFIDIINTQSERIAKKYNQKPKKISFTGFMR
jgi:hypothetical protein